MNLFRDISLMRSAVMADTLLFTVIGGKTALMNGLHCPPLIRGAAIT